MLLKNSTRQIVTPGRTARTPALREVPAQPEAVASTAVIQAQPTIRHIVPEVIPEAIAAADHMVAVPVPAQAVAVADQLNVQTRAAEDNV